MTAADLLADADFAGLVFQHWHITGDERQPAGPVEFAPRTVGEDLIDRLLSRESETFEVRPLKWKRLPCEVCDGTGGVFAYQNGRACTHPCPRGCKPNAQYSDIVSDGGMDPRHAYEQARASVTVQYDLGPAEVEGAIRDKLIELGWTPPNELGQTVGELAELARQIDADPHLGHGRTLGQLVGSLIDEGRLSDAKLPPEDFELIVRLYATQPTQGGPHG